MVTAAVAVDSPPRKPRHHRPRGSPSGNGDEDFELRHWRASPKRAPWTTRRLWAPPEIEIPHPKGTTGVARAYTSLRDIMSSPEYAASSPGEAGTPVNGGVDVRAIRHPLVKHAAYAYLKLTPSAREEARRRRKARGPLCRILLGCLGFVGALFGG